MGIIRTPTTKFAEDFDLIMKDAKIRFEILGNLFTGKEGTHDYCIFEDYDALHINKIDDKGVTFAVYEFYDDYSPDIEYFLLLWEDLFMSEEEFRKKYEAKRDEMVKDYREMKAKEEEVKREKLEEVKIKREVERRLKIIRDYEDLMRSDGKM